MISAEEAREMTDQTVTDELDRTLKNIEKGVRKAIMQQRTSYTFQGYSPIIKAELEKLGYTVEHGSQYNEEYMVVKW